MNENFVPLESSFAILSPRGTFSVILDIAPLDLRKTMHAIRYEYERLYNVKLCVDSDHISNEFIYSSKYWLYLQNIVHVYLTEQMAYNLIEWLEWHLTELLANDLTGLLDEDLA